ncbi:hypothetical protein F5Y06DRAFT_151198 [Hypoxylon sp. FL0890]|nr:hypothetical protein F5Y06DRAFT_151198 [Hypoxylon sp. FL0890]
MSDNGGNNNNNNNDNNNNNNDNNNNNNDNNNNNNDNNNNNNDNGPPQDPGAGLSTGITNLSITGTQNQPASGTGDNNPSTQGPPAPHPRLQPFPEPEIIVPTIPPRPEAVRLDLRTRIQRKGSWFLQNLSLSSRYYARDPAERQFQSAGEEAEPFDILLMIRDASAYGTREELMQEIANQLDQTDEYSRDRRTEDPTWRRLHTNPEGKRHLLDFDTLIEELRRMDADIRLNDQSNAANQLFTAICEAYNWDVQTIQNSGLHRDIMQYVALHFIGRLRFLRDEERRNPEWNNENVDAEAARRRTLSEQELNFIVWEFSIRIHCPDVRSDIRMVEWFANWAQQFNSRDSHGWEADPRLNVDAVSFIFERVYYFPRSLGITLISEDTFAFDVEIIESWLSYKCKWSFISPNNTQVTSRIHNTMYLPWVAS